MSFFDELMAAYAKEAAEQPEKYANAVPVQLHVETDAKTLAQLKRVMPGLDTESKSEDDG